MWVINNLHYINRLTDLLTLFCCDGLILFVDSLVFLIEKLCPPPKIPYEYTVEKMLQSSGCCALDDVKSGIWIAGASNKSFKMIFYMLHVFRSTACTAIKVQCIDSLVDLFGSLEEFMSQMRERGRRRRQRGRWKTLMTFCLFLEENLMS